MSVKIRMKRLGTKKKPFYRIVVADSRSPRNGRFIEELGYYNPITQPRVFKIDAEKAVKWMSTGAKPTPTVARLFKTYNVDELAEKQAEGEEVVVEATQEEVEKAVEESAEVTEEASEEVVEG